MKSKILFFIVFIISCPVYLYAVEREAIVNEKFAPVYEKMNESSKKLRTLTKGVKVNVIEIKDNWLLIDYEGKRGWALKSDFIISETAVELKDEPAYETIKDDAEAEQEEAKPSGKAEDTKEKSRDSYFPSRKLIRIGIKGGACISSLTGDNVYEGNKSRLGIALGAFAAFKMLPFVGAQLECQYIWKGAKGETEDGDVTIKFDYIEVPLLLRGAIPLKIGEPYLLAGPYLGYAVNKAVVFPNETNTFDDVKSIDYGLTFGAGFEYHLNKLFGGGGMILFLEARYSIGLTTIHDAAENPLDVKNNAILIELGIGI